MHERNSLRIVDDIDLLTDDKGLYRNLWLTYAVRDGIISHCGELGTKPLKPREELFDLNLFKKPGQFEPATWEGCVVKISDKIAYLGRDIEDAIRLRFINDADMKELKNITNKGEEILLNTSTLMHRMIVDIVECSSPENGLSLGCDNMKLIDKILDFNNQHIYQNSKFLAYRDYSQMVLKWIYRVLIPCYAKEDTIKNVRELPYKVLSDNFLDWLCCFAI